jgi:FMN phosphatase YigB (HAD superfamily)
MTPRLVETLIFDLGDVLFSWSSSTTTSIAPRLLRSIRNRATWSQYQTNAIDQSTCYEQCAHEFGATNDELREALDQARTSLVINEKLVSLIKELREVNKQLRVYAISNIAVSSPIVPANNRFLSAFDSSWMTTCNYGRPTARRTGRSSTKSSCQEQQACVSPTYRSSST